MYFELIDTMAVPEVREERKRAFAAWANVPFGPVSTELKTEGKPPIWVLPLLTHPFVSAPRYFIPSCSQGLPEVLPGGRHNDARLVFGEPRKTPLLCVWL